MRMSLRLVRKPHMKNRAVAIDIARRSVLPLTGLLRGMLAVVVIAMPEYSFFRSRYGQVITAFMLADNIMANCRASATSYVWVRRLRYSRFFPAVRIDRDRPGMSVGRG